MNIKILKSLIFYLCKTLLCTANELGAVTKLIIVKELMTSADETIIIVGCSDFFCFILFSSGEDRWTVI